MSGVRRSPGTGTNATRNLTRAAFALALALLALVIARPVRAADSLDEIKKRGALQWGADEEGGGPFIYPRDDDPNKVTGFEVDLAEGISAYLKVKSQVVQANWDKMPDMLRTQKVDVILNGYEWSAARAEQMESSIPYFVYALQLVAHKDDATIQSIEDLRKPRADGAKRRVGVLGGSAAERYVDGHLGDAVERLTYDGGTDVFSEIQNGKLDATLQDTPIAKFYGPRFPSTRPVGEPVGEGHYVVYARKGERALIQSINEAIIVLYRTGELERIYKKYGIWDRRQEKLGAIAESGRYFGLAKALDAEVKAGSVPAEQAVKLTAARKRGLAVVRDYGAVMLQSAGMTVVLSVLSFPCAIALGLLVAVGRLYGPLWLRVPLTAYVEFLRGTPLMLQLYFIFFFLPEVGIRVPAFATAVIGLAVNYSAYEAEVYRAGLQSIPGGQMEAALSLGMSRSLALRRIIVPQAVRIVIPPVVNDFIALFKDTSVCSVVTIVELTKRYSVLSMSTQATVELMILTAVLYLVMSYPLSIATRRLEKRFGNAPMNA